MPSSVGPLPEDLDAYDGHLIFRPAVALRPRGGYDPNLKIVITDEPAF